MRAETPEAIKMLGQSAAAIGRHACLVAPGNAVGVRLKYISSCVWSLVINGGDNSSSLLNFVLESFSD